MGCFSKLSAAWQFAGITHARWARFEQSVGGGLGASGKCETEAIYFQRLALRGGWPNLP